MSDTEQKRVRLGTTDGQVHRIYAGEWQIASFCGRDVLRKDNRVIFLDNVTEMYGPIDKL